jgi:hypothetical protein
VVRPLNFTGILFLLRYLAELIISILANPKLPLSGQTKELSFGSQTSEQITTLNTEVVMERKPKKPRREHRPKHVPVRKLVGHNIEF